MFSIIIPLYNKENSISGTIDSVLSQSFQDFELVIVDDGSTDNGCEVVSCYSDSRIKVIRQKNQGPSSARNRGVKEASYDWILFLDADDILLPGTLDHFKRIVQNNISIPIYFGNYFFHSSGRNNVLFSYIYKEGIVKNNFKSWALQTCMLRTGCTLIKKDVLEKYPFNESLRRYEDAEFAFRVMKRYKMYRTSMPVLIYDCENVQASIAKLDIKEDYLGYLGFLESESIWETISLYQLYVYAKQLYPEQAKRLYANIEYRFDLKLVYYCLRLIVKLLNKIAKINEGDY